MTLKDEFSRSVGAQSATAEQWRNNSRKNRERGKAKNKTKQNKNQLDKKNEAKTTINP